MTAAIIFAHAHYLDSGKKQQPTQYFMENNGMGNTWSYDAVSGHPYNEIEV